MSNKMVLSSSSKRVQRDERLGQSNRLPMVSFRKASDHLLEQGVSTIVSLNGDNELPQEVECMAAEFNEVIQGEISTVVSPMILSLKEAEDKTKVKISTLKKVISTMKGENYPFYRVDRLKILYIPLFPDSESVDKKITFSIQDRSMLKAGKPKKVSEISAPLNKMSMIELSASYFVPREHIEKIEFGYKASGVPVTGRAFAAVYLAFYVHKELIPARLKTKAPIVLIIRDVDIPADVNKVSSIRKICDRVNKKVENNRIKFQKEKMKNQVSEERRREEMVFVDEFDSGSQFETDSGFFESSVKEIGESSNAVTVMNDAQIAERNIIDLLPRRLPVWNWEGAILDTGAPEHWFYNPNLVDLEDIRETNNLVEGKAFYRVKGVEVKLGSHWVRLKEVMYARKEDIPLISYTKLVKAGIVDSIKSSKENRSILCLEGKVIFELDDSNGYMVFKQSDDVSRDVIVE